MYRKDLTYLDSGIELTEFEKTLIAHPAFQRLRAEDDFPFRFGSHVSGLHWTCGNDGNSLYTPVNPLSVTKAGGYISSKVDDLRTMAIFLAKVCRDQKDPRDVELIRDLSAWIDGLPYFRQTDFRWVREDNASIMNQALEQNRAKLRRQLNGNARVLLLLLGRLNEQEQGQVHTELVYRLEENIPEFSEHSFRYFIGFECIECQSPVHRSGNMNCRGYNAIALVDTQRNVATVMSWIPQELRRFVKPVRYSVSRNTFNELACTSAIKPEMVVIDLSAVPERNQDAISSEVFQWVKLKVTEDERSAIENEYSREHGYRKAVVCTPIARQFYHAIIIAGSIASSLTFQQEIGSTALSHGWVRNGVTISHN